jgi:hypothetical protein
MTKLSLPALLLLPTVLPLWTLRGQRHAFSMRLRHIIMPGKTSILITLRITGLLVNRVIDLQGLYSQVRPQPAPPRSVPGRVVAKDVLVELQENGPMPVVSHIRLLPACFRTGVMHYAVDHLMAHGMCQPRQLVCAVDAVGLQRSTH